MSKYKPTTVPGNLEMTLRKRGGTAPPPARLGLPSFNPARTPEQLVGVGFRCWLAGYETSDIDCWETGWNFYARELGTQRAKKAVTELACWVRLVRENACRKISYFPFGCTGFCPDECVAISMVAASQHSACPAMRACAFALLGSSEIDGVVDSADGLASVLSASGYVLSQHSICDATLLAGTAGVAEEMRQH
jgi:hypothetical protein